MCRVLKVSPSGYYAWRGRQQSPRDRQSRKLLVAIKVLHKQSKQTYGSPRICRGLSKQGIQCSENRVARLMRVHGIRAKQAKRFKATTDSRHDLPVAENILDRQFEPEAPNQAWAADITYVWTGQGWLYLAVVMDLFSRRIVGFSMGRSLARALVIEALEMALGRRRVGQGLLHHSDRGSQYASGEFQRVLVGAGIICSMSRRGNCWDNAPVESFFSTLKCELVHHRRYRSRAEARLDIFEYIEVWYNRKRLHSSLGYRSPAEYEAQMAHQAMPMMA